MGATSYSETEIEALTKTAFTESKLGEDKLAAFSAGFIRGTQVKPKEPEAVQQLGSGE